MFPKKTKTNREVPTSDPKGMKPLWQLEGASPVERRGEIEGQKNPLKKIRNLNSTVGGKQEMGAEKKPLTGQSLVRQLPYLGYPVESL